MKDNYKFIELKETKEIFLPYISEVSDSVERHSFFNLYFWLAFTLGRCFPPFSNVLSRVRNAGCSGTDLLLVLF